MNRVKNFDEFINETLIEKNTKKDSGDNNVNNGKSNSYIESIKSIKLHHLTELVEFKNKSKKAFDKYDDFDTFKAIIDEYDNLYDATLSIIRRTNDIKESNFENFHKTYKKKMVLINFNTQSNINIVNNNNIIISEPWFDGK